MNKEIVKSAMQSAPPVGVSGWQWWNWVAGHDLNWYLAALVSVATLFYIGLQSYYLIKNKGRRVIE
jgi:hypothetical protein